MMLCVEKYQIDRFLQPFHLVENANFENQLHPKCPVSHRIYDLNEKIYFYHRYCYVVEDGEGM